MRHVILSQNTLKSYHNRPKSRFNLQGTVNKQFYITYSFYTIFHKKKGFLHRISLKKAVSANSLFKSFVPLHIGLYKNFKFVLRMKFLIFHSFLSFRVTSQNDLTLLIQIDCVGWLATQKQTDGDFRILHYFCYYVQI